MNGNKPKYIDLIIRGCSKDPSSELRVRIYIFMNSRNLRSHTVKHFMDPNEFELYWVKRFLNEKSAIKDAKSKLHEARSKLQEIGCPYFTPLKMENLPCADHCQLYHECGEIAESYEEIYQNEIIKILNEGGKIPLSAIYTQNKKQLHIIAEMPYQPFATRASQMHEGDYNLMTCYAGRTGSDRYLSFIEMKDIQRRKIKNEAKNPPKIDWRTRENWGISGS